MNCSSKFKALCFLGLCFSASLFAQPFSISVEKDRDYEILEEFFRICSYEGEFGYVLNGVKPVSVLGSGSLDSAPFFRPLDLSREEFKKSVLMKEALSIWERIVGSKSNDFVLTAVANNEESSVASGYEIRLANLPKLRQVVKDNIGLFQFILGPGENASELAEKIASSKQPLVELLNGSAELVGIVLGFGTQNSIFGGRVDSIIYRSFSFDLPPFPSKSVLMKRQNNPSSSIGHLHPVYYGSYFTEYAGGDTSALLDSTRFPSPVPNKKFSSLEKELCFLDSKTEPLPEILQTQNPRFIFGAFKTDTPNQPFFKKLENAQVHIQALLEKPSFLEEVLQKIGGEKPLINCKKPRKKQPLTVLLQENSENWLEIVHHAKDSFDEKSEKAAFVEAFCNPSDADRETPYMMGASKAVMQGTKQAISNLEKSDLFFEKIGKSPNLKTLVPEKVYTKIEKEGEGKELDRADLVRIGYTFEDVDGNILYANHDTWLHLSDTFPVFAHGVQGMQCGEKRTLFIHPAFAYGALTTLPPCITLLVKVHLIELGNTKRISLPPMEPHDFSWFLDPEYLQTVESSLRQLPRTRGAFYRDMLEQIKKDDVPAIIASLRKGN